MKVLSVVLAVFVFLQVLFLFVLVRKAIKAHNEKYSLFDDFLLFTGSPLLFGYMLFQLFNPVNLERTAFEMMTSPFILVLLIWAVVSTIVLLIRNPGKEKKKDC